MIGGKLTWFLVGAAVLAAFLATVMIVTMLTAPEIVLGLLD
jgi:hypothetical protein